jgi:hypothetical protein
MRRALILSLQFNVTFVGVYLAGTSLRDLMHWYW